MEWKDITSYSRDDKKRIPSVLEFIAGTLRIKIHRHIHYEKDRWLVSCLSLNIDKVPLNNKELERAKFEGLAYVNGILQTYSLLQKPVEDEMKRLRSNSAPLRSAKTNSRTNESADDNPNNHKCKTCGAEAGRCVDVMIE